ncbi:MAG: methyltransferase domain-containing protein [Candidatus Omnitrophica bacterium]|nr:methyltransferase domain-containing protein [Candidatus Omnitrophota bacterium]
MKLAEIEKSVKKRYAQGAKVQEAALCCPVQYDRKYLEVIPKEIIDKDYGCGDPSQYLKEGDVVLDLGSGAGKICFIASQIVGPKGKVIGVDFNPAMLTLARKYQKQVGNNIGWHNVNFKRGKIQDLWGIRTESIDVIISNCVLNLVRPEDKQKLFLEMHRVLKKGGRAAISDIVSDELVPAKLKKDPELWSGCISGAFQEMEFLKAFEGAGFYGVEVEKYDEKPWRIVEGIEFRSITVTALKGKEGACWERNQAVIYKGPWKQVVDDDRHILKRGVRTAVCDKTFQIYSKAPYRDEFIFIEPKKEVPLSKARPFDCSRNIERDPRESKGKSFKTTTKPASVCMDGGCC